MLSNENGFTPSGAITTRNRFSRSHTMATASRSALSIHIQTLHRLLRDSSAARDCYLKTGSGKRFALSIDRVQPNIYEGENVECSAPTLFSGRGHHEAKLFRDIVIGRIVPSTRMLGAAGY
jgi:hypothetical protein